MKEKCLNCNKKKGIVKHIKKIRGVYIPDFYPICDEISKSFLNGIWYVKVITGPFWFKWFNFLKDKKIIRNGKGHNVITKWIKKKWGSFDIEDCIFEYKGKPYKNGIEFILRYNNGFIIDNIFIIRDDYIFGKFYLVFFKKKIFIGEFKMTKGNEK